MGWPSTSTVWESKLTFIRPVSMIDCECPAERLMMALEAGEIVVSTSMDRIGETIPNEAVLGPHEGIVAVHPDAVS